MAATLNDVASRMIRAVVNSPPPPPDGHGGDGGGGESCQLEETVVIGAIALGTIAGIAVLSLVLEKLLHMIQHVRGSTSLIYLSISILRLLYRLLISMLLTGSTRLLPVESSRHEHSTRDHSAWLVVVRALPAGQDRVHIRSTVSRCSLGTYEDACSFVWRD